MNKTQKGFAVLELLLVLVIITAISGTGWYVVHTKHQTDKILAESEKTSQSTVSSSNEISGLVFQQCVKTLNQGAQLDESNKRLTCVNVKGQKFTHTALATIKTSSQPVTTISDWKNAPSALKLVIAASAPIGACTTSKSVQIAGNFAVFDYGCDGGSIKLFMTSSNGWKLLSDWPYSSCDVVQKNQVPIEFTQYQNASLKTVARCLDRDRIEHQTVTQ